MNYQEEIEKLEDKNEKLRQEISCLNDKKNSLIPQVGKNVTQYDKNYSNIQPGDVIIQDGSGWKTVKYGNGKYRG